MQNEPALSEIAQYMCSELPYHLCKKQGMNSCCASERTFCHLKVEFEVPSRKNTKVSMWLYQIMLSICVGNFPSGQEKSGRKLQKLLTIKVLPMLCDNISR